MKPPHIGWPKKNSALMAMCAAFLFSSCGIPIVPSARQLENFALRQKMELVTDVELTGLKYNIPENTRGPEQDLVPFLVPDESNPATRGWLVFPALRDLNGNPILNQSNSENDGEDNGNQRRDFSEHNAAWLFTVDLDADKAKHSIDLKTQIESATYASLPLSPLGSQFARMQSFPLRAAVLDGVPRLAVLSPSTGFGGVNEIRLYIVPAQGSALSDRGGTSIIGGGTAAPGNTPVFYYQLSTPPPTNNSSSNKNLPIVPNPAIDSWFVAPKPDGTGVLLINRDARPPSVSTNIAVNAVHFLPQLGLPAGGTAIPLFPFEIPDDVQNLGIPYFVWNPSVSPNVLNWSFWRPGLSGEPYYSHGELSGGAQPTENTAGYPVVRVLNDGTTLGMHDRSWYKLDAKGGSASSASKINTGTMIFLYERADASGVPWMYFSEAQLVASTSGKNLRMRAWKIKQSDLIP